MAAPNDLFVLSRDARIPASLSKNPKQFLTETLAWVGSRKDSLIASLTAVAILVFVAAHYLLNLGTISLLPLYAALAVGGTPLLFELAKRLSRFDFGSDLLAGFSIVTAILLHQYLVACVVVLMLSGGTALEQYATRKASSALGALAKRMPTTAHLAVKKDFTQVPVDQIRPGDIIGIFPHELCPVDGEVIAGHGDMDESYLTGEPFEIAKAPGSRVLSGAVNGDALMKVRATKLAVDSRYARIVKVVEEAERNRPRMRRIGDRLGAWYTPIAVGIGIAGWVISGSPERFLAVIVIATPCPLLIAIPVAIIGGISLAAKHGIVVKHPSALEQIDSCHTFIFDKTGTLTYGRPVLTEVICSPGFNETEVLSYAASLEQYSRHPLAQAVLNAARAAHLSIEAADDISEKPGGGLMGDIAGNRIHITGRDKAVAQDRATASQLPPVTSGLECLIFVNQSFAALCRFHDEPRTGTSSFIRHLRPKHAASKVILLSGDRQSEAEHIGKAVGIEEVHAGKTPEEKLVFVAQQNQKQKTLFVGDGINDAPAMLTATVSIAMGPNSDVTSEAADAIILDSSLRKVDELIHIARRIRSIALQSAVGGMCLSGIGMVAATFGYLPPLAGAITQEFVDLAAVLNALRVTLPTGSVSDF